MTDTEVLVGISPGVQAHIDDWQAFLLIAEAELALDIPLGKKAMDEVARKNRPRIRVRGSYERAMERRKRETQLAFELGELVIEPLDIGLVNQLILDEIAGHIQPIA